MPILALAVKAGRSRASPRRWSRPISAATPGRRVLRGRIERGVADRINTVLWFSDLRNYTRISDTSPPEEIIPLLNDYAEAVDLVDP